MLGLIVNLAAVILGSMIGVIARKKISENVAGGVLTAIGLCVLYIGITGLFTGANAVVILIAFAIGTLIGAGLDLDGKLERSGQKLSDRFSGEGNSHEQINAGLAFFLVSCTGAYTITACFNAGIGDNTMLYTKAVMDIVVSMTMAAGMGIGVMLSVIPMLIYQGLLILFSGLLSPLLSESMISAMSCTGAVITIAIGTNMIGATKLKAVNYIPAIILAPLFQYIAEVIM